MAGQRIRKRRTTRSSSLAPDTSSPPFDGSSYVDPCEPRSDSHFQQVRSLLELFLQKTLSRSENARFVESQLGQQQFPRAIWRESLLLIYRLLSVWRVESQAESKEEFSWLDTEEWRRCYSLAVGHISNRSSAELVSQVRLVLRLLSLGGDCDGQAIAPWGGTFFASDATPLLDQLTWDEDSFAAFVTSLRAGVSDRLHVSELSRLYESLLDVDPLITAVPMVRLRRGRVEVVVSQTPLIAERETSEFAAERHPACKTSGVTWVSDLPAGCFVLRTSLSRKGAGAYYTPSSFVRFLVEHSLGAAVRERSSPTNPDPTSLLQLKVLDPAMGTGAFLLEACRYLGRQLLEACRSCALLAAKSPKQTAERWQRQVTGIPNGGEQLWQSLQEERQQRDPNPRQQLRVERLCRQLIARHCLYGVDKNPLSAALARLLLWFEAGTEILPQSFLDAHLIAGDSLAGPLMKDLARFPGDPKRMLPDALMAALRLQVRNFTAEVNGTVTVQSAGEAFPNRLLPLRVLAAVWSGAVQLGVERCDDAAWLTLAEHVAATGRLPERLDLLGEGHQKQTPWTQQPVHAMLARGLGVDSAPCHETELREVLQSSVGVPAVAFELAFPEVFIPNHDVQGHPHSQQGFDVVLGNPPWEAIRPQRTEFFGDYDLAAWAGHTRRERRAAETRLIKVPEIAAKFAEYLDHIEGAKRACDRLYERQKIFVDGDLAGRYLDQYRVFLERKAQLVTQGGRVSVVVPASFRANAGAVGVRRLYLIESQPEFLYTFHNTRQSFAIASGMQFCLLSSCFGAKTDGKFELASALEDEGWLFAEQRVPAPLRYTQELLETLGGPHVAVVNLATPQDRDLTEKLIADTLPLGRHPLFAQLPFQTNPAALNATTDSWRLEATDSVCVGDPRDPHIAQQMEQKGFVPLHEKGTISRYQARERQQPRYMVDLRKCADKPDWLLHRQHFRLMGRSTIHAAEPDKVVFALIPPGGLVSNSALVESAPHLRPSQVPLTALTILNSYVLNYLARQQVVLNLNLFIFRNLRIPRQIAGEDFLARAALRLVTQDVQFGRLWDSFPAFQPHEDFNQPSYPILDSAERQHLIAAVNAVVAHSYHLSDGDYVHILEQGAASATAGERTLARDLFNELTRSGLSNFVQRHNPFELLSLSRSPTDHPRGTRPCRAA